MSGKNPLITRRDEKTRRSAMLDRLTQPAIQNNSPGYNSLPTTQKPNQKQLIVVTLDKLRPYEGNPRRTKNPAFDEIKASIKSRGLDHAPNVTQRPGDDFYTIADGGNTRLQALKELFTETQDPRFWSIECVFKPWSGDDIDSELNILIGHLAENDVRGDLTFIEKALGIREVKALYEKKYNEFFSHRKLADKLGENGYPISNQLLSRMEQCLTYLYPHIPNILLSGMGKAQIDKLIGMHNKAKASWDKYLEQYSSTEAFDEIWMSTLSPFDEDVANFSLSDLQDTLIGNMVEAFGYQVSYDALKLEIDLEERKLQKLREKQPEIIQRAVESELHLKEHQAQSAIKSQKTEPVQTQESETAIQPTETVLDPIEVDSSQGSTTDESTETITPQFSLAETVSQGDQSESMEQVMAQHFSSFGILPESARQEDAENNGLVFANTGRQPITNIWKLHPNRKYKMDAYSIALDVAEECGLDHLIQHVVHEPVDYSFTLLPLDIESPSVLTKTVYDLLSMLTTDQLATQSSDEVISLPAHLLVGTSTETAGISDLMLVRLFRLIRIIRYLKDTLRQGEHHA
ncbi:ParB family protein [Pasteurella multocida]